MHMDSEPDIFVFLIPKSSPMPAKFIPIISAGYFEKKKNLQAKLVLMQAQAHLGNPAVKKLFHNLP